MMEARSSSGTSVLTRATRRTIPEDAILHNYCRGNLKFNMYYDSCFYLKFSKKKLQKNRIFFPCKFENAQNFLRQIPACLIPAYSVTSVPEFKAAHYTSVRSLGYPAVPRIVNILNSNRFNFETAEQILKASFFSAEFEFLTSSQLQWSDYLPAESEE
jgi:hypothetical protein